MPSWNIHIAHAERLLRREGPCALGIADENSFLFGNLVPDIYVGWMVPDVTRKIRYRETHFANTDVIPEPRSWEFWDTYCMCGPGAPAGPTSLMLGAWAHLETDRIYNSCVIAYNARLGVPPGERTRIRKQGDFDLYGRTLPISREPRVTPALLGECAAFPQYPVAEKDARGAVAVAAGIVRDNEEHHVYGSPAYSLLTAEFFAETGARVDASIAGWLETYAELSRSRSHTSVSSATIASHMRG